MSDSETGGNGQDVQSRIALAGKIEFGTADWRDLMPRVADLLDLPLASLLERDRPVALNQIAALAGVEAGTAIQWRQRTRKKELTGDRALPDPDHPDTFPDKPLWWLSTALGFLLKAKKWPLGRAGRPLERGERGPRTQPRAEGALVQ